MSDNLTLTPDELESLLIEVSTATDLQRNIEIAFPKTTKRQFSTQPIQVFSITYQPFVGMKMISIKTNTKTDGQNVYDQTIQLNDIIFNTEDDEADTITIKAKDGEDYTLNRPTLDSNLIKVRCNCLDFRYRMAAWNFTDKSIVGSAPALYKKKTNRPPINPSKLPGMCKHLLKVMETLEGNGFIKSSFQ